jgi:GNAT superfamily N-acetyltransferase
MESLGYYTLAAGAVAFAHVPREVAGKSPRHPVPVILLARLAVDRSVQGQGHGAALLADALRRSLELSRTLGVFAVEVLAIDEQAAAFYIRYGFTPLLDNPRHMYLPIRTIEAAVSPSERERGTD